MGGFWTESLIEMIVFVEEVSSLVSVWLSCFSVLWVMYWRWERRALYRPLLRTVRRYSYLAMIFSDRKDHENTRIIVYFIKMLLDGPLSLSLLLFLPPSFTFLPPPFPVPPTPHHPPQLSHLPPKNIIPSTTPPPPPHSPSSNPHNAAPSPKTPPGSPSHAPYSPAPPPSPPQYHISKSRSHPNPCGVQMPH